MMGDNSVREFGRGEGGRGDWVGEEVEFVRLDMNGFGSGVLNLQMKVI